MPSRFYESDSENATDTNSQAEATGTIANTEVSLFDDVALYIKDRGSKSTYKIGRILWMRNKARATDSRM